MNRNKRCEFIFYNFPYLSEKKRTKLLKFIYTYNKKYIYENKQGTYCLTPELDDIIIEHIYNFIKANIWRTVELKSY